MADFQNRLISGIFGGFSRGFLHRLFVVNLQNPILHVYSNLNFWPKLSILQRLYPCKGYRLCKMAYFQNRLISGILAVFPAVFCTEYF